MKHYTIIVSGKVQGVFYRKSAVETATQLSLKGFVRNETDGSVFIEVEGALEQLNRFVEWCRKGPSGAIVSNVEVKEGEIKNYSMLEIRT